MIKSSRVVPVLISINALVFAVQVTLGPAGNLAAIRAFGLSASGLEAGGWWQFLTHAFLHGNTWHLLFNMISLWFVGRPVERLLGGVRFSAIYLLSAIGGGLAQIALGGPDTELIGASGAVFGILAAFSTIFADREVVVLLFFVLPLKLRARYLAQGLVAISVLALATGIEPWIGHAAHIGGAVVGYLATRASGYGNPTFLERWLSR